MNEIAVLSHSLAKHLRDAAELGRGDAYYRLARIVARVLVSKHLRRRRKWCALVQSLHEGHMVEERLVMQAIKKLRRRYEPTSAIT